MIEKLDINSTYFEILENMFTDTFTQDKVKFDIMNNSFTQYYVYKDNEEVVALINYQIMYERAELIQINVLEEKQNKGIASKLIEYMINDCVNKNVESITLEVRVDNDNAIHLYEKFGFIEISKRIGYYKGIDGILMEKKLV